MAVAVTFSADSREQYKAKLDYLTMSALDTGIHWHSIKADGDLAYSWSSKSPRDEQKGTIPEASQKKKK